MATYSELVELVRTWSNRDSAVLSDAQLGTFMTWAADKAYRQLRIPAVEKFAQVSLTSTLAASNSVPIPSDLTEFISLTKVAGSGVYGNTPLVYNEKVDYRSFQDGTSSRLPFWSRVKGYMILSPYPESNQGDVFRIYYYGRLGLLVDETSPNWLRDENERIVLFGALAEAFAYLGEEDMQAKYTQMFQQEINELNAEESRRKASGGNTTIQYSSCLI